MAYVVETPDQLLNIGGGNTVLGSPKMSNCKLTFKGENNLLYCEPGVNLRSCKLEFAGDNGLIMLGSNKNAYKLDVMVNTNCSLVIDRNVYFNTACAIIISEECTVSFGSECLVSSGVRIRTADPHLIYDASTEMRINPSKNVIVGDHVWLGQGTFLLKGTTIGSGSIIGAMSVVAGKSIESNSVWAGNPAKRIKRDIFWEGSCVHSWTEDIAKKREHLDGKPYLFSQGPETLSRDLFVASKHLAPDERLAHYLEHGFDHRAHNRLAIDPREPKPKSRFPFPFKRK